MTKFGRPMWYSHYANVPETDYGFHPTIELALIKMGCDTATENPLTKLAALDCRVLLQFDSTGVEPLKMQAKLVEFRMRTIFNISENSDITWNGYPSEPMLAEAAARLLNICNQSIMTQAPDILESAIDNGFLARTERGDLVARTLFTVAHDLAIQQCPKDDSAGPEFHRPLRLVLLLEHLVTPDIWAIIRKARPVHDYPDAPTLEDAFRDAWVNLSHFVQLGDHASFSLHGASELLKRGAAMQTFNSQYNVDGGLPLHFGDPLTAVIAEENSSLLQFGTKNTKTAIDVRPDPRLIGSSKKALPIISVIMQLGVEKDDGNRVVVETSAPPEYGTDSLDDINQRHYVIALYGCTSETYNCIPVESQAYSRMLKARNPFTDFARARFSDNASSLYALKPIIYDKEGICTPWS